MEEGERGCRWDRGVGDLRRAETGRGCEEIEGEGLAIGDYRRTSIKLLLLGPYFHYLLTPGRYTVHQHST